MVWSAATTMATCDRRSGMTLPRRPVSRRKPHAVMSATAVDAAMTMPMNAAQRERRVDMTNENIAITPRAG